MHRPSLKNPSRLLSDLIRDQAGLGYTMQLTIALPFCVLLVAMFVDLTLTLNVKTGVNHATIAAARAATVWWPAEDLGEGDAEEVERLRMGRIHLAAVNALAPFANGAAENAARVTDRGLEYPADAPLAWAQAYRNAGGGQNMNYLATKWVYAAGATRVSVEPLRPDTPLNEDDEVLVLSADEDAETFNSALRVTVEYQMPFQTPGVGRLFGVDQGGGLFTKTIRSTFVLEKEGAKSATHVIGFRDYYADPNETDVFRSINSTDDLS